MFNDATYQGIMNCRLRKGVLCVMLIRYAGHRLGHRQWPCAVYLGSHCKHRTNTEIQRKTQMTDAIVMCCNYISWITLHRAHLGYYERLQVLCFKSHPLDFASLRSFNGFIKARPVLAETMKFPIHGMPCTQKVSNSKHMCCTHRHSVWQS